MTDDELKTRLRGVADYLVIHVWMLNSRKRYRRARREGPEFVPDEFVDGLLSFWHQYEGENLQTPKEMLAFFKRLNRQDLQHAVQRLDAHVAAEEMQTGDERCAG